MKCIKKNKKISRKTIKCNKKHHKVYQEKQKKTRKPIKCIKKNQKN